MAKTSLANWIKALVIIAAGLWIYSPIFCGEWIWDDLRFLPQNPLLHDPDRLWKIWFQPQSFIEYYPIEATVQWAQWDLWHNGTVGYHATNLVLHLASAFLLWHLLAKLGLRCGWLAALLFTVHPLMVESVAWIVELKNTLSLPPLLLAMCVYLDYDKHRLRHAYLLALALFLMAMLCKNSVMMFPFVILLYAWWRRGRIDRHDLQAGAGFLVISVVLGAVGVWVTHLGASPVGTHAAAGWWPRLAAVGWLGLSFLIKSLFPIRLTPVYPTGIVDVPGFLNVLPWLLLAGFLLFASSKRDAWGRHALFGIGFFLINLVPPGFFILMRYQSMVWSMDHMGYLPLIGLFSLAAAGFGVVLDAPFAPVRTAAMALVTLLVVLLAATSRSYAAIFINQPTFWTYTIQANPNALPARSNLSILYLNAGMIPEAIQQAEAAVRIDPDSEAAHVNLGDALLKSGRSAEAIAQFAAAVKINPNDANDRADLGAGLAQAGQRVEALKEFSEVLKLQPDNSTVLAGRGEVRRCLGDWTGAMADFDHALALAPDSSLALLSRGVLRQARGDATGALSDLRRFRQVAPDVANADYALLWIWVIRCQQDQKSSADRELSDALKMNWNAQPGDLVSLDARFLLGETDEDHYFASPAFADKSEGPARLCEAWYYAGIKRLLSGNKQGAAAAFHACVATAKTDDFEYTLAQGELNALGSR